MAGSAPVGARRYLTWSLISIVIGVALTSIMLVPALELASESVRADITPQYAITYSLNWAQRL